MSILAPSAPLEFLVATPEQVATSGNWRPIQEPFFQVDQLIHYTEKALTEPQKGWHHGIFNEEHGAGLSETSYGAQVDTLEKSGKSPTDARTTAAKMVADRLCGPDMRPDVEKRKNTYDFLLTIDAFTWRQLSEHHQVDPNSVQMALDGILQREHPLAIELARLFGEVKKAEKALIDLKPPSSPPLTPTQVSAFNSLVRRKAAYEAVTIQGLYPLVEQYAKDRPAQPLTSSKPGEVTVASIVYPSPEHPDYSADRACTVVYAQGRGGLIASMDGVGQGGKESGRAAELTSEKLRANTTGLSVLPTIQEGQTLIANALVSAAREIKALQAQSKNPNLDTTAVVGLICRTPDGHRILLTANVGDSCLHVYEVREGEQGVVKNTREHSLPMSLAAAGLITEEEAWLHPQRNEIFRTVGGVTTAQNIDFRTVPLEDNRK